MRFWLLAFMFLITGPLTGCSTVENLTGVELATAVIEPSATPAPTSTPDLLAPDLPNTATKEFAGSVYSMQYPDGWQTDEGGQSMVVFDPDASAQPPGEGVSTFIALTRTTGVSSESEPMASEIMHRYLQRGAEAGFGMADAVPESGEALAFSWGEHDAAIFAWESAGGSPTGIQILVMTEDLRRFVIISAQTDSARWADFEPIWQAIVSTFTLNGQPLPAADFLAAYEQL